MALSTLRMSRMPTQPWKRSTLPLWTTELLESQKPVEDAQEPVSLSGLASYSSSILFARTRLTNLVPTQQPLDSTKDRTRLALPATEAASTADETTAEGTGTAARPGGTTDVVPRTAVRWLLRCALIAGTTTVAVAVVVGTLTGGMSDPATMIETDETMVDESRTAEVTDATVTTIDDTRQDSAANDDSGIGGSDRQLCGIRLCFISRYPPSAKRSRRMPGTNRLTLSALQPCSLWILNQHAFVCKFRAYRPRPACMDLEPAQ